MSKSKPSDDRPKDDDDEVSKIELESWEKLAAGTTIDVGTLICPHACFNYSSPFCVLTATFIKKLGGGS